MKKMSFIIGFLMVLICPARAQNHLTDLINEAVKNNETIRQQEFLLDKSLYALKEARSLFLPQVSLSTTYTLAGGGRTVDIPIGDLLNGAYKTLNQLTASTRFPQVDNQHVLLNPNNFYDLKMHTIYPVINAEIGYNKKIKEQQYNLQKIEIDIYKRELVKEIKIAYYKYLQSIEAIKIYESALKLVKENARINTSLFNNQKVNRTLVVRSENEVIKIVSSLETATLDRINAAAYLNFLINRPLTAPVQTDSITDLPALSVITDTLVSKREELLSLNTASNINSNLIGLANTYKKPKVNSFFDLGAQGFDFNVNKKAPYYFAGLSLEWNLFAGGRNKYKVKQALIDKRTIESQANYVEQQLQLQLNTSINNLQSAFARYHAATSQVVSSTRYYNDMLRLYKEGTVLFIELLDAQNQLVSAQLQSNISLFDAWIRQAEIERANAGFKIK